MNDRSYAEIEIVNVVEISQTVHGLLGEKRSYPFRSCATLSRRSDGTCQPGRFFDGQSLVGSNSSRFFSLSVAMRIMEMLV